MRAFEQNVRPELPANQCRRDFRLLAETCLVVENTDSCVWPNPTPLVPGLLAKSEETALRLFLAGSISGFNNKARANPRKPQL